MLCKKRKITDIVNFKRIRRNETPRCTKCRLYEGQYWSATLSIYCDEINKNLHYSTYVYVVI